MVWKRSHAAEFHEEDLDQSPLPPHVVHCHTDINIDSIRSGCQTHYAWTSYISLPKSPVKQWGTTNTHLSNADDVYSWWFHVWALAAGLGQRIRCGFRWFGLWGHRSKQEQATKALYCMSQFSFSTGQQLTYIQDELHICHWLPLVPQFLDEFFHHDTPTADPLHCCSCADDCSDKEPLFCCISCYEGFLFCRECIVKCHYGNPFHRIEVHLHGYSL